MAVMQLLLALAVSAMLGGAGLHHARADQPMIKAALAACASDKTVADTIQPIEGKDIDLGTLGGIVYYTVEPNGYHVVATLGTDTPVRFTATLAPDQSVTVSTPRAVGEPPMEVRITRHREQLTIDSRAGPLDNAKVANQACLGNSDPAAPPAQ